MATQAPIDDAGAAGQAGAVAPPAARRDRPRWLAAVTVVAALVALACAAALPFAPVEREVPVVTWPQSPTAPVSTSLMLVSQAPGSLRVETTCAAARAAGERGDGLLLATMNPTSFKTPQQGLLWRVDGENLRLDVAGTTVDDSPLPAGDCELALVTVPVAGPPPATAPEVGPGSASDAAAGTGLQLQRDGVDVGDPVPGMPRTDTLATGLTALDPAAGERLSVALSVNDEFQSSPTPVKLALVVLLVLASAAGLVCLWLLDRGDRRAGRRGTRTGRAPPRWSRTLRPRLADAATVVLALVWTPLAPMTDDDGYYAAMARDVGSSGYVGQYFQLFDQSFVPLTWPWYVLSWWEQVADTPLGLRVPALVMVLLTWVLVRRSADLLLGDHPRWGRSVGDGGGFGDDGAAAGGGERVLRSRAVWLLALVYAAAWTPYVMGVRPEAISALGSAVALVAVLTTVRTGRRLPLALGVLAAAMSAAAHPTGAVALAPLLAGLPACWRALRAATVARTLLRVLAVVAPGAVATAAGFADGTFYDFVRGREVFKAVEAPLTWTDEWIRYGFLLNPGIPMGAYAKRVTVLVALLALALALLLVALSRGRRLAEGLGARPLAITATTTLLAFVTLWVTPSKWTHHFGALSALTPLLVLALLLLGPDLARRALAARGAGAVGLGVVGAVVVVAAVGMTGPDLWPYSWSLGSQRFGPSPYLSVVQLSSPLTWVVVAGLVALALRWRQRRAARDAGAAALAQGSALALRTAAVTTVVLLGTSTAYLVGSFALAAAATAGTYSPSSSRLLDPLGTSCGAAGAISVADDRRARPLDRVAGDVSISPPGAFVRGDAGAWRGDPPPSLPDDRAVWGSLADGNTATGTVTTPWYAADGLAEDWSGEVLTALVAGDLALDGGNSLVAEFGVHGADGSVDLTTAQLLGDDATTTEWRTVRIGGAVPAATPERPVPAAVPQVRDEDGEPVLYDPAAAAGSDVVRLRASDGATGDGGWVAVSEPAVAPLVSMDDYLPEDAVVATSWQITYHFPCQRQVTTADGIADRPDHAVLVGPDPLEGAKDAIWQNGRGGLYAPVPEAGTLVELVSAFTDDPEVPWGQLARIEYPFAAAAWDLEPVPDTTSGLSGPTPPDLAPYTARG